MRSGGTGIKIVQGRFAGWVVRAGTEGRHTTRGGVGGAGEVCWAGCICRANLVLQQLRVYSTSQGCMCALHSIMPWPANHSSAEPSRGGKREGEHQLRMAGLVDRSRRSAPTARMLAGSADEASHAGTSSGEVEETADSRRTRLALAVLRGVAAVHHVAAGLQRKGRVWHGCAPVGTRQRARTH